MSRPPGILYIRQNVKPLLLHKFEPSVTIETDLLRYNEERDKEPESSNINKVTVKYSRQRQRETKFEYGNKRYSKEETGERRDNDRSDCKRCGRRHEVRKCPAYG